MLRDQEEHTEERVVIRCISLISLATGVEP